MRADLVDQVSERGNLLGHAIVDFTRYSLAFVGRHETADFIEGEGRVKTQAQFIKFGHESGDVIKISRLWGSS